MVRRPLGEPRVSGAEAAAGVVVGPAASAFLQGIFATVGVASHLRVSAVFASTAAFSLLVLGYSLAAPTAPAAAPASPATPLPAQPVSQESDLWSQDVESDIWSESEDGSQVEQQS